MTTAASQIHPPRHDVSVQADDPRAYLFSPVTLPPAAQAAFIEQTLRDAASRGLRRIALYPAGRHSARLAPPMFSRCGVTLVACLDDARTGSLHGVPIVSTQTRLTIDAVVISSDSSERFFAQQARTWLERVAPSAEILRPYASLENPDFTRQEQHRQSALARLHQELNGRLNLGCGGNPIPGWTNIDGGDGTWYGAPPHPDVIPLDVFDALGAIPDDSCDFVYSEHFYEHFTLADGFRMAREWARVLKPGGSVRVVTPDLHREARIYLGEALPTDPETYLAHKRRWLGSRHSAETSRFLTPAMLLNFGTRLDGHQFIYDFDTLREQLLAAGFERVSRERFGQSTRPEFRGIDRHDGSDTGRGWLEDVQLVVEAVRRG